MLAGWGNHGLTVIVRLGIDHEALSGYLLSFLFRLLSEVFSGLPSGFDNLVEVSWVNYMRTLSFSFHL